MPTIQSFGSRMRLPALLASMLLAGCASGPRARRGAQTGPQQYLEAQLLGRGGAELDTRTADGGLLYHAEFDAAHMQSLGVPYETLKAYCSRHQGELVAAGPAQHSAAGLSSAQTPEDVRGALVTADTRGVLGAFRCLSKKPTWTAHIEPLELLAGPRGTWRLQLFAKAFVGSDLSVPGPVAPAAPPSAAAPASSVAAPAVPPAASATPPAAAAAPAVSPLDPRPLGPARSSDERIADPQPFGVHLGSDPLATFTATLQLDSKPSACKGASPRPKAAAAGSGGSAGTPPSGLPQQCWKPSNTQATEVRASFADVGQGPVLAELQVRYPASAAAWLSQAFQHAWGEPDLEGDRPAAHAWSWRHTLVQLYHVNDSADQDVIVQAQHRPTIERARLPASAPARKQSAAPRVASPWQLQLGYEAAHTAQAKLEAGGFTIAANGCNDGGPYAVPVLIRSCPLQGRMDGLRSASATIVDLGDNRPRLASLEYQFDKKVLADTQRELRGQYGEPLPGKAGALTFWTGPVAVVVEPSGDGFALRYLHGRLTQLFENARAKNRVGEKAHQKLGL